MRNGTVWIAIALATGVARGSSADISIFQLQHTAWSAREGAPSPIFALAQTIDGYLWLGTPSGLHRFDGDRFEHYKPRPGQSLSGNDISTLMATPDGGLWIGFRFGGANFIKNDRVSTYGKSEGFPPSGTVRRFALGRDGTVWAVANQQVLKFENRRWVTARGERSALDVLVDRGGALWVATATAVYVMQNGTFAKVTDCERGLYLAEGPDGVVWVLEQGKGARAVSRKPAAEVKTPYAIRFMLDRSGNLWSVGSTGIVRSRAPELRGGETFGRNEGTTAMSINAVLQDRDGNIWTGSYAGLDRFRETTIVPVAPSINTETAAIVAGGNADIWAWTFANPSGLHFADRGVAIRQAEQQAYSLARDKQGTIWVGGAGALWRFENGRSVPAPFPEGTVKPSTVQAIAHTQSGELWISVSGSGVFRWADGVWSKNGNLKGLPNETALSLLADSVGRVWFGHLGNKASVWDGASVKTFSSADGFPVVNVETMSEGTGRIWFGGERGLAVFSKDRFHQVHADGDFAFNGVSGILETKRGDLWLNTIDGIVRIPAGECARVAVDDRYRVHYELFDFVDGLQGKARQLSPVPTLVESSEGMLWFLTTHGIVRIDPEHVAQPLAVPAVFVRSIEANGRTSVLPASLPAMTTNVHILFTAPDLSTPERVRFRYKLDGADQQWQDAGGRRDVFYTNLSPKPYTFHVAARVEGTLKEALTSAEFNIAPAWFQTIWFQGLIALSIAAIGWSAYRWRLQILASRLDAQFHERLAERTRVAQDLHDTLLQGFVSASLQLGLADRQIAPDSKAKPMVTEVLQLMRTVIEEGRNALLGMRLTRADAGDLVKSFSRIPAEAIAERPVAFRVLVEGVERSLHALVRDDVYRIGREAIINALHHAEAANIEVDLRYSDAGLSVFVRDDGRGMDPQVMREGRAGHFGLRGMREAAERIGAKLRAQSLPGEGAEIELTVPAEIAFAPAQKSDRTIPPRSDSGRDCIR